MENKQKIAIIVAGGNGAGKSTFINNQLLEMYKGVNATYINADDWQKQQFGQFDNKTTSQAKEAQEWADNERKSHLAQGRSFITETVLSHPSKIDLIKEAKANGYEVDLYHISLDNADLALERISNRVLLGGHDVDTDKVKARYERVKDIVAEAIKYADKTMVYDNSVMYRPHQKILSIEKGSITSINHQLPDWVNQTYKVPLADYYEKLKATFSDKQSRAFNDLQNVIKELYKNNPPKLEEKLNALSAKIPDIANGKYQLPEPPTVEKKPADKGR